jgi:hypothetical protein
MTKGCLQKQKEEDPMTVWVELAGRATCGGMAVLGMEGDN